MLKGNVHSRVKVFSRSKGHSAVAAAAYRSGEKLEDERLGITFNYGRKSDVIYSEILTPWLVSSSSARHYRRHDPHRGRGGYSNRRAACSA